MLRFIATADWQCRLNNLARCEATVQHLVELGKKHAIDGYFLIGDLKNDLNPVDQRVNNFLVDGVQRLREVAPVIAARGNHDAVTMQDGSPSCMPSLQAAGATAFDVPGVSGANWPVLVRVVPFMRNKEQLRNYLGTAARSIDRTVKPEILLFHEEIQGCKLNTMKRSAKALSLRELHPERYLCCIGGHIHYQQSLGENTWYVGSPFCHDWGEVNQCKGFLLIEVDVRKQTVKITPIDSRIPGWYDPDSPGFPYARRLEPGATVRVRVNDDKELDRARAKAAKRFPGCTIHVVKETEAEEPVTIEGEVGNSDGELLRSYLEQSASPDQIESMLAYLQNRIGGQFGVGIPGIQLLDVEAEETLCFERVRLTYDKPGLTLVTGANRDWHGPSSIGAGKSSLLSLPAVALFGETLKGQKHDDWRRDGAKAPTVLKHRVRLHDGRVLCVERGRQPSFLKASLDGQDISMGDISGTQRLIESLTGVTWDVFTNAIYIGQSQIATLLHGTDKQRKELFSRFQRLERFIKAQERVRKDWNRTVKEYEFVDGDRLLALADVERTRNLLAQISKDVCVPCSGTGVVAGKPCADCGEPPIRPDRIAHQLQEQENQARRIEDQMDENQKRFEAYLGRSGTAAARIEQRKEWLEKLEDGQGACPLCGNKLSFRKHEEHERELKAEIEAQEAILQQVEELQSKNRKHRTKLITDLTAVRSRMETLREQGRIYLEWKAREEGRISRREIIDRQKAFLEQAKFRVEAHANYCRDLEARIEFLRACSKAVSREGVPAFLCSRVSAKLNRVAKRYSQLFSEGEIQVQFHAEDGELDVQLTNLHGGSGANAQSRGELGLASWIALFATRDLLVPANVLMLDEPCDGLDAYNIEMFVRGLHQVLPRFGNVFVVTHNPHLVAALEPDYHLEVVKENKVAVLEEIA